MKETGLMFKAPLVLAILSGQKTQTRRVVKPQPAPGQGMVNAGYCGDRHLWLRDGPCDETDPAYEWRCPMGKPGDRIYVRETFNHFERNEDFKEGCECFYRADGDCVDLQPWRPAIHMPKHAARIWLEISGVRVERLQSITRADIKAEGVEITEPRAFSLYGLNAEQRENMRRTFAAYQFQELWDSTTGRPKLPENKNSKRYARVKHWLDTHPDTTGWAANPWVWVIDFKTISTTGRPA